MSEARRTLGCLCSEINVHGEEVVGRRVGPERTHVERQAMRMYERREETWRRLTRQRVAAFIELFLLSMVYGENGHRRGRQPPVIRKMLKKALIHRVIPFIDRRLVYTMDESMWPMSTAQFKELDHYLTTHLPSIHAGQPWQNIVYFFKEVEREREKWKRLDELERDAMEAVRRCLGH